MEFLALGIPLILPNRDYMHSLITTVYWSRLANRSVWSLSWKRRFLQLVPEDWEAFELGASNKSLKMTAAWCACFEHFFTSCQHELVHRLTVNMISGWIYNHYHSTSAAGFCSLPRKQQTMPMVEACWTMWHTGGSTLNMQSSAWWKHLTPFRISTPCPDSSDGGVRTRLEIRLAGVGPDLQVEIGASSRRFW